MPNEILQQGHLVLIEDYQFQDGNGSKDKFLIVLHRSNESAYIIHTLTTSQNKLNLPSDNFGCLVAVNIPYFLYKKTSNWGKENLVLTKTPSYFLEIMFARKIYPLF
jgi:hypothetical protein